MSRQYKYVIKWTNDLLDPNHCPSRDKHSRLDYGRYSYYGYDTHEWDEDQRFDYAKAYYCNAVALMHMGDTLRAIERMEKVLEFDPGDGTAAAQLLKLRLKAERDRFRKLEAKT